MAIHGVLNVYEEDPAPLEDSSSLSNIAYSQAWWLMLVKNLSTWGAKGGLVIMKLL